MTKMPEKIYLLGGEPRERLRFRPPVAELRKRSQIHEAILQAPKQASVWIATRSESTDDLLREVLTSTLRRTGRRLGRLLLLFPPRLDSLPALEELFEPVAWGTASLRLLPHEELAEALTAENRRELFIGGFVDKKTEALVLYRGDFTRLAVALSIFKNSENGPKPDPAALSFTDFGQTICLGKYEAAADSILYEADPEYRRQVNASRRHEEKSFGASLRRLRHMKGLRQSDFNSIPAKTIARIERGAVDKPHRETLQRIAKRLGVEPNQIETY